MTQRPKSPLRTYSKPVPRTGPGNLLARPGPALLADLDQALEAIAVTFPIPAGHRRELPDAVRELSRLLTAERGGLSRSYWASSRLTAAYLRYFLPWNLFRLAWLLPGLDFTLPEGARLLDVGSGPLTLPLALWCARPELRGLPLDITCTDVSPKAMETGRAVFEALAGKDAPWRINLVRAPADKALHPAQGKAFDLIMAGNVLNEICARQAEAGEHLTLRLAELMAKAGACLKPGGRLLLVEPGTRLGGKLIALSRQGALDAGFKPLAPCPHAGPCPMPGPALGQEEGENAHRRGRGPVFTGWCHFIHPADNAPLALEDLAAQARLEKDRLALSCLLLEAPGEQRRRGGSDEDDLDALEALFNEIMAGEEGVAPSVPKTVPANDAGTPEDLRGPLTARIISAPIRLPGEAEPGRYACCGMGLALMKNARRLPSGAAVTAVADERKRDPKTGAVILVQTAAAAETGTRSKDAPRGKSGAKAPQAFRRKAEADGKRRSGSAPRKRGKPSDSGGSR